MQAYSAPVVAMLWCHTSHEITQDTVATVDSHAYEKEYMTQWLRKFSPSHSTGMPWRPEYAPKGGIEKYANTRCSNDNAASARRERPSKNPYPMNS